MHLDFASLAQRDRYKLLTSLIVPRPIAWVTTKNRDGSINAAPFSFFNCMGSDPALIFISFGVRPDTPYAPSELKDTAINIEETGEFVVNLVPEELAQQMNICATDFPPGVSEVEAARLELAPSQLIETPRLAASPASLECTEHTRLEIGNNHILIGEVIGVTVRDELIDTENFQVDTAGLHVIGRMGGGGGYTTTKDAFEIPRSTYLQWLEEHPEPVTAAEPPRLTEKELAIVERCRQMVATGVQRHAVIAFAAREGLRIMESIKMVRELYGVGLGEAKNIVSAHPAYARVAAAHAPLHDALIIAMMEDDPDTVSAVS